MRIDEINSIITLECDAILGAARPALPLPRPSTPHSPPAPREAPIPP